MQQLLILGTLLAVSVLAWVFWRKHKDRGRANPTDRGKQAVTDTGDTLAMWQPQGTRVLTSPERVAYASLRTGLPEHIVLAQVPLARFLKVPTRHSYSEWLRRVGMICADLVVCDSSSHVVAVVDIRPPEAQETDRSRQRHARMDRVLKAANIKLHVWREDAVPSASLARDAILGPPEVNNATSASVESAKLNIPRGRISVYADVEDIATIVVEDDGGEVTDPPPSTWFDNLDSGHIPLAHPPVVAAKSSNSPQVYPLHSKVSASSR